MQNPLVGSGFGHPFIERVKLPDVTASYELEPYVPHNSVIGLWAPDVARRIEGVPTKAIPVQRFARGHYFILAGRSPFRHLVYPVPPAGGLGIHVTLDLSGAARFGPDVQWVAGVDYGFDESRGEAFYRSIRRYYPALADGQLQPGYVGVRPKLSGPDEPAADFAIRGPAEHGVPGLINLYGIESPGLTAALALANHVLHKSAFHQ